MMKIVRIYLLILTVTLSTVSCDDTTDTIGGSLIKEGNVNVSSAIFAINSKSIKVDSVLSRNTTAYIGRISDPQTGGYVTGDAMVQFHTLSNIGIYPSDTLYDQSIVADSCEILLFYSNFYGDSLTTMTMRVHELEKPMLENRNYYSNFDPYTEYVRKTDGINENKAYTLTDMTLSDSLRNVTSRRIKITLNNQYKDLNGNTYNNYGTYLLRTYYEHPEYFSANNYTFLTRVMPGFYFQNTGGLGAMAYVDGSRMNIYYRIKTKSNADSTVYFSLSGTEEVLQTTKFSNDNSTINSLVSDQTCTYLKTPAGVFTEMTIPINDIYNGHETDTINTAKLVIPKINDSNDNTYNLNATNYLLLLPKSDMYTFFENNSLADNRTSYLTTLSSNAYTFSNISNLVSYMRTLKDSNNEDWNKIVLVPVSVTASSSSNSNNSTTTTITKITNNMSLTSTRLVGGENNSNGDINLSVIYSKFK